MKIQVSTKNLSVTYFRGKPNQVNALQNISIDILQGDFIIFFGPSGCGKSTLLYSIAGLETGIEGDVFIEGKNIRKMNDQAFEKYHQTEIGMIFQAYYLIPSINVIQNVMLPQVAMSVTKTKREKRAMSLLKHFGVEKQAYKLPNELSGGQQQRVSICRALANDPAMILADEPVGNLDSKSASDVMTLLQELNRKNKKTIILVTHDSRYLDIADRVFYIKDGKHIDTKINKKRKLLIKEKEEKEEEKESNIEKPIESKESKVLKQMHHDLDLVKNSEELNVYKAKNIVLEILTGFSLDEINGIINRTEETAKTAYRDYNKIFNYLNKNSNNGGLGMNSRSARKMTKKIQSILEKIKFLEYQDSKNQSKQAKIIRNYLAKEFKSKRKLFNKVVRSRMDSAIMDRLRNNIGGLDFQHILDKSKKKHGVGLDLRLAVKMAKRMELLMLGRYNLPKSKPIKIKDKNDINKQSLRREL